MKQSIPDARAVIDNELDIQGLFTTLWRGKRWIIGFMMLGVVAALVYAFFACQRWSTMAVTDRPTVNMLGSYYAQQQFLRSLDNRMANSSQQTAVVDDDVYREFTMQVASWDTRRDFWLQTNYYRQRRSGNSKADAVLCDEMINNIIFTPRDPERNIKDSVKLIAETASDANNLLRQYVAFASERAASHLNDELKGAWTAHTVQMQALIKQQETVAQTIFDRQLYNLRQGLKIAEQNNIDRSATELQTEDLPDAELFMLGRAQLQARIENLSAVGPSYNLDYDQNRAVYKTLSAGPTLDPHFQTYRYLRTPEEPVNRDSPRRVFLMVMWGIVGAFFGAGVVLVSRRRS